MDVSGKPSPAVVDRRTLVRRAMFPALALVGFAIGHASAPDDADAELVQVTSVALDRGQSFWAGRVGPTWRDARVVLVDHDESTPCGAAGPAAGPFYCALDGKIYLDLSFLRKIRGDLARAFVIAHELGHHAQVVAGDLSTGSARELGADCLAGLWIGDEMRRGRVTEFDIEDALAEAASVGDDRLCPTCSPEDWSHGSGSARAAALALGIGGGPC